MLIESKIKPRHKPTRTVKVFGKDYVFAQRPGAGDAHVADVGDPQAVQALVATGAYAEFTAVVAPSTLTAPPTPSAAERKAAEDAERKAAEDAERTRIAAEQSAQAKAAADAAAQAEREAAGSQETPVQTADDTPPPPAADAGQQAPAAVAAPEIQDAAQTLLSGTPQSIRKAIGAGTPAEVIKAALAIEQAQQKPRPSVVATLKSAEG